jgi:benzoyl-CoA reductase/2-hydroxyglutaryl-CoA dehydratase subunit BcrC/BadD/HgdB
MKPITDKHVGITATVPAEIILAAGMKPADLNNLFISSERPRKLVTQAEAAGFSYGICNWIKGIYATVLNHDIKIVICVTGGDCSNTIALGELLSRRGVRVIAFEYPWDRDREKLLSQMENLAQALTTTWAEIELKKVRLDRIRAKLRKLDRLTYAENLVTGLENHLFLVSSSDFRGNPDRFENDLDRFLDEIEKRKPIQSEVRLGFLGVPPIFSGFYELLESLGARVVFNEVQRQFSMPFDEADIVERYLRYTYPYSMEGRLRDIKKEIHERRLDGLIHYTQTFCYRQLYDMILRESSSLPILTLEGDSPGRIDSRTAFRIETFVEMLKDSK